jgi:hypothetical protein
MQTILMTHDHTFIFWMMSVMTLSFGYKIIKHPEIIWISQQWCPTSGTCLTKRLTIQRGGWLHERRRDLKHKICLMSNIRTKWSVGLDCFILIDTLLQQIIYKNIFKFKFNMRLKTCANLIPMKLNINALNTGGKGKNNWWLTTHSQSDAESIYIFLWYNQCNIQYTEHKFNMWGKVITP